MQKKKIAFFAEILIEDFDGASRTMFQILNRIDSDKYDFMFFCGLPPKNEFTYKVITLPTMTIPFNTSYKMVIPAFSKNKIFNELDQFKPDIIHIASPSPLGNVAIEMAGKFNIPVISIYHTHFISYMKYYFRKAPFLISSVYNAAIRKTRKFYNQTSISLIPTIGILNELVDLCKIDRQLLKIWPRGIDENLFNPKKRDTSFIRDYTGNNKANILFASRLVWEKNASLLQDLYSILERKNFPYNLIIAGDGVAKNKLQETMPSAYFTGHIDHSELAIYYASSDVFFFPSDTESFGNVILEAMASGLPCVAANGGGPVNLIEEGKTGYLCQTDNINAFWDKIELILENEALKNRISANSIEFAVPFSWENLADEYFNHVNQSIIDHSN